MIATDFGCENCLNFSEKGGGGAPEEAVISSDKPNFRCNKISLKPRLPFLYFIVKLRLRQKGDQNLSGFKLLYELVLLQVHVTLGMRVREQI